MPIPDGLFESLPKDGWLTCEEAELLWRTAQTTEGPILEVGCYQGRSTCLLAALGRPLYVVDPLGGFSDDDPSGDNTDRAFSANLEKRLIRNVSFYRQRIEDWVPRPVGFAYLDGDHTCAGTKRQIEVALACGARAMCLHDFDHTGGGREIVQAVSESPLTAVEVAGRMAYCELRGESKGACV